MRLILALATLLCCPLASLASVLIGPALPAGPALDADAGQSGAAIAFNGEIFMLAWTESDAVLGGRVRAVRVAMDGSILDDEPIELGSGKVSHVTVASARKSFLVAWEREGALLNVTCTMHVYDSDVVAARLTAEGRVDVPEHELRAGWLREESPSLASDGIDYLFAWQDMIDFDGTWGPTVIRHAILDGDDLSPLGGDTTYSPPFGRSPSVAVAGTTGLVTWAGRRDMEARRIDIESGNLLDPAPFTLGRAEGGPPRCAAAGTEPSFLVGWIARGAAGGRPMVALVPREGSPLPVTPLPMEAGTWSDLALGRIGGAWIITWLQPVAGAIVGARLSPTGALLDPEPLELHPGGIVDPVPAFQGAGCGDGLLAFAVAETGGEPARGRVLARHISDDWATTGEVSPAGARPLRVRETPGGLVVSYEGHGSCAQTSLAVGRIGDWSLAAAVRTVPTSTDEVAIATPPDDAWLLAVATDGTHEGTAGHDSFGWER